MQKIHPSVRQWVLSFLAVDLIFWLLVGWGCVTDAHSCLETWSFGSYFFYFPMIFVPMPDLGAVGGVATSTYLIPVFGIFFHVLLGLLVGWALRKRKIAQFVSFAVALVVLFGGSYGVAYYNYQAEMSRESGENRIPTQQELTWMDWEEYVDPEGRFSLQRAFDMTPVAAVSPYNVLSDVTVAYSTDKASYLQPNYSQDSWFIVSTADVEKDVCFAPEEAGHIVFDDERTIGATTFRVAMSDEAGMGNRYEQTLYRTHIDSTCWEIATTLHYASDFTGIDEGAMNASQAEARTMLDEMVSTFRFNL